MLTILHKYKFVEAFQSYTAQNDDELDIKTQDVILYSEEVEKWANGINGERSGWFPLSVAHKLETEKELADSCRSVLKDVHIITKLRDILTNMHTEISEFAIKFRQNITRFTNIIRSDPSTYGDLNQMMAYCINLGHSIQLFVKILERKKSEAIPRIEKDFLEFFLNNHRLYLQYMDNYSLLFARSASRSSGQSPLTHPLSEKDCVDYTSFSQFFYSPITNLRRITTFFHEVIRILPRDSIDLKTVKMAHTGLNAVLSSIECIKTSMALRTEIMKTRDKNGVIYCLSYGEPVMVVKVNLKDKTLKNEICYLSLHTTSFLIFSIAAKSRKLFFEKELSVCSLDISEVDDDSEDHFAINALSESQKYETKGFFDNFSESRVFFEAVNILKSGQPYEPFWREKKKQSSSIQEHWSISDIRVDRNSFKISTADVERAEQSIVTNLLFFMKTIIPSNVEIPIGSDILRVFRSEHENQDDEEETYSSAYVKEMVSRIVILENKVQEIAENMAELRIQMKELSKK